MIRYNSFGIITKNSYSALARQREFSQYKIEQLSKVVFNEAGPRSTLIKLIDGQTKGRENDR